MNKSETRIRRNYNLNPPCKTNPSVPLDRTEWAGLWPWTKSISYAFCHIPLQLIVIYDFDFKKKAL